MAAEFSNLLSIYVKESEVRYIKLSTDTRGPYTWGI
jgi:hypothetical protein